jgi:hypothetical protein
MRNTLYAIIILANVSNLSLRFSSQIVGSISKKQNAQVPHKQRLQLAFIVVKAEEWHNTHLSIAPFKVSGYMPDHNDNIWFHTTEAAPIKLKA